MIRTINTVVLLSFAATVAHGQSNLSPSSLPSDVLPAAGLSSDPLDRNLTTIEIPVDATPSFTNASATGETQKISYFVAEGLKEPLAIVYGDVILATVPELLASASNSTSSLNKRALSIFRTDNIWPGAVVTYKWQSEQAKGSYRLEDWTEAKKRWTDMLPWLVFKELPPSEDLQEDVLTLVATTNQYACFSPIGKRPYGQMSLDNACGGAGTYTHELGHSKFMHTPRASSQ